MIRTVIVEDESLARDKLRRLLARASDVELVGEAATAEEAIAIVQELRPDLLFLDIRLDDRSGFEVLEALGRDRTSGPLVVFATAYDAHAVRAFEARALDYLLKPFDERRFDEALSRARERLTRLEGSPDLRGLLEELRERQAALERHLASHAGGYSDRVLVRDGAEMRLVALREVDWVSAADNYVELHVQSAKHLLRETLARFEQRVEPHGFLRIHRGVLVNLERVRSLRPTASGDLEAVLVDGTTLPISRSHRGRIAALLGGDRPL
ncbi:MAG: response regulator transcription factor [Candidatus Eisenbacteria bacterium]|uniref:Response regulator transcription factor n=1 Tax=Eiseniibacteriota bacterium TaxID=2212470 RepID=A0A849SL03_UNCEI|nr:response regulator transcription factor [Candidatus Eisenbacteria bacterium]